MAIQVIRDGASRLPLPEPYSDRTIMEWVTPTLNENVLFTDPRTGSQIATAFRLISCNVDMTQPVANRQVVYVGENGQQITKVINQSGDTLMLGWGIISIGAAIESGSLQVGN